MRLSDAIGWVTAQVIADLAGRLPWALPTPPGARHDARAAGEHDIGAPLAAASITAYADSAYHGTGPTIRTPFRRSRYDRATGTFTRRPLSAGQ